MGLDFFFFLSFFGEILRPFSSLPCFSTSLIKSCQVESSFQILNVLIIEKMDSKILMTFVASIIIL